MNYPELSIIIPVRDERENISPILRELTSVLGQEPKYFEIIFVDDGSKDDTLKCIKAEANNLKIIHWLSFDRNYGQTAAFDAGLKAAKGRILITMDGDLQNAPADIPKLLEGLKSADLVCGYRVNRKDNFARRISSKISNWVRNKVTKDNIIDVGCSLKAMRRECFEKIKLFEGMHRFLPTLAKLNGFRVIQVPVGHRPRLRGKPKYGISNRIFKASLDLLAVRWMQYRYLNYIIKEKDTYE